MHSSNIKPQGALTVIAGLPGSGKTTYLNNLLAAGKIDMFYDDYQKGAPDEDKSNPFRSPNFASLSRALEAKKRVAIADIRYVIPEELRLIKDFVLQALPSESTSFIYFANDPEACKYNVKLRGRKELVEREVQFITEHSAQYYTPKNQTIPVIMG